jgi:hypothetical protein
MSEPPPSGDLSDTSLLLRRNHESGWIDLVLESAGPAEAVRRLDGELEAMRRRAGKLSTQEALDLQLLTAELEALRAGLNRLMAPYPARPALAASQPALRPGPPWPFDEFAGQGSSAAERVPQVPKRDRDLIFLGRGVSGRLNDRRSDQARLEALGLPVLSTPVELADASAARHPRPHDSPVAAPPGALAHLAARGRAPTRRWVRLRQGPADRPRVSAR